MGQSIFDWDDEEAEKEEPERRVEPVSRPEPVRETRQLSDPWNEEAVEKQDRIDEPVEYAYYQQDPGEPIEYVFYEPEPPDETARQSGLAWSAGIIFFSSVAFMLLLGWFADLLLGSSPWGIVGGIILGSIIGFIQFFRTASRIFNPQKEAAAMHPLMPRDEDEK